MAERLATRRWAVSLVPALALSAWRLITFLIALVALALATLGALFLVTFLEPDSYAEFLRFLNETPAQDVRAGLMHVVSGIAAAVLLFGGILIALAGPSLIVAERFVAAGGNDRE